MSSAPHPASMGAMPPGARGCGMARLDAQRALSGSQLPAAEAAQRPRAMLPGGSGLPPFSRLADFRQSASPYPPASRVSINELLGDH
jgi:hypothetical protein